MASSGSLKELSRALNAYLAAPTVPLPDELNEVLDAYLTKHEKYDDAASARLHDELLSLYQRHVRDGGSAPACLTAFVLVFRRLLPCLRTPARIFHWWDLLKEEILVGASADQGRGGLTEQHGFDGLAEVLESYDAAAEDAPATNPFLDRLIALWMDKYNLIEVEGAGRLEEQRDRRIRECLMMFGKKRPKEFLLSLNNFFIKRAFRKNTLRLLSEFVQNQPPHLYLVVQTPLFGNLLRCLQTDTSTTVVSLALTALIMLLPHMPSSLVPHLPALFNIYARLLFWDQERAGAIEAPTAADDVGGGGDYQHRATSPSPPLGWEACAYAPEHDEVSVPHLLNYFTILYGLYPINFMDYVRKPQRYLRHANAPSADEIEVQPTEIRHKSERFRRCHLLHPNFYTLTIESEKTDFGRWIKSEPAEVVAECTALYSVVDLGPGPPPQKPLPVPGVASTHVMSEADRAAGGGAADPALLSGSLGGSQAGSSRVQSMLMHEDSQSSNSNRDSFETRCKDPSLGGGGGDSPTLGPHLTLSASQTQLQDLINSNKAIKSGLHQSLANQSVPSLSLSHDESLPDRTSIPSTQQATAPPRSPVAVGTATLPSPTEATATQLSILQRQILLLQNDLIFERHLKQQHMAHIGEMRQRQLREAATEAEAQNLIIANRNLKNRLEEAKKAEMQARREGEKRQAMAKKWESDLSAKLKVLRDESRRTRSDEQALRRELGGARAECEQLRRLLCDAEVRELGATQSGQAIEINSAEMERLRAEVGRLAAAERDYQAREAEREDSLRAAREAEGQRVVLGMRLEAREAELARISKLYQAQIAELNRRIITMQEGATSMTTANTTGRGFGGRTTRGGGGGTNGEAAREAAIEGALAASRARQADMQRQYDLLMRKYTALQSSMLDMHGSGPVAPGARLKYGGGGGGGGGTLADEGDLSRSVSPAESRATVATVTGHITGVGTATRPHRVFSDPDVLGATSYNVTPALEPLVTTASGSGSARIGTPLSGGGAGPTQRPGTPPGTASSAGGSGEAGSPEQRYFGRGGVQNRIRKDGKDGKDGKEKKLAHLRGLRSFNLNVD